jgi:signal recognition particle GTPase
MVQSSRRSSSRSSIARTPRRRARSVASALFLRLVLIDVAAFQQGVDDAPIDQSTLHFDFEFEQEPQSEEEDEPAPNTTVDTVNTCQEAAAAPATASPKAGAKPAASGTQRTASAAHVEAPAAQKGGAGGIWGFLSKLTGNKALTREDLEPVVAGFREHLHTKNVAYDIADKLCESVVAGLVGQKAGALTTIKRTVRDALESALARILTPRRNIDILRDIAAHRATSSTPFSIVFMGVNGVGKSTNLAKVASWLRQSGLKVMLAACDTFRSGAVEQLRVHSRRLQIPLFERGYGKDDTGIAQAAIQFGLSPTFLHLPSLFFASSPSTLCVPQSCCRSTVFRFDEFFSQCPSSLPLTINRVKP